MKIRLALGLLATFLLSSHSFADAGKRVVLPDTVVPDAYRIDFTPDIAGLTFTGTVEIDVQVRRATDRIMLNSAELEITAASLDGKPAKQPLAYDAKIETLTLAFDQPVATGKHTLKLSYKGKIRQTATALFALDYEALTGAKGQQRAIFSQFENSDARRFVPCWDEPGIKSTFEIAVTLPTKLMPISNMPVASATPKAGGLTHTKFARSPRMSTYLMFFGAGDFERVHRMVAGVDVGIVVKRGDTAAAAYALDATADLLPYFNDYFGQPYPLPKLDLIAGPGSSQFFGAMENWGAIFYFEEYLLIDSRIATQADRQGVYGVIAHEVAHQWFGDLVTMAWWDDLWLNEGFASWMANKSTAHFHPEWNVWLQSLREKQSVMQRDARDGTHPIITPIEDVQQAANAFDDITYTKGEGVIRALEAYIGETAFRAGVRRYMREHKYGNTVTDDLWAAIGKESPVPVAEIAHDLTRQAGVPMVNLLSARCAGKETVVSLNQTRYIIDASSTSARTWHLPVKVATLGQAPVNTIVVGEAPTQVTVPGCGPVILNAGQGGYLRSRYTHEGLAAIIQRLSEVTPDDQLGLLNDTRSLASIGDTPMADYMDLTRSFKASMDPVVLATLVTQLMEYDDLYRGLPTQAAFRAYGRRLLKPMLEQVGNDARPGESANTEILRASLIATLTDFGDADVIAATRERFQRYLAKPGDFSADARHSLLRNVASQADEATWKRLYEMAKASKSELERQELYGLLGSTEGEALARRALELALSGELPATTGPRIVSRVASHHPELAIDFAIAHWEKVVKSLETGSAHNFLPGLARNSKDLKTAEKLKAFAEAKVPQNARQDYVLAGARIRYFANVRATRLPEIDRWLAAQNPSPQK